VTSLSTTVTVGLSTVQSGVNSLSTAVAPLVQGEASAASGNATSIGMTVGGGANGTVSTAGPQLNNTTLSTVNAATCSQASGPDSMAAGTCASASSSGATAVGSNAQASSANTTAVGFRADAGNDGSVAIGYQARATGDPTTAIGANSLASGNNAVALGAGATATATNSVALGANSLATTPNSVSVGSPGNERTITNVAPGVNPTDAVNVSQLNQGLGNLQNQISENRQEAYGGAAAAMAAAGLKFDDRPGKISAAAAAGYYHGQSAVAIGIGGTTESGLWRINGGISVVPTLSKPDFGMVIGVTRTLN
jgi:trimeric autotransporter adhesin